MTERSVVIIGLPESGKTTFLGALWHLVTAREIDTVLRFHNLRSGDVGHLNAIAARWREARVQERTAVGSSASTCSIGVMLPSAGLSRTWQARPTAACGKNGPAIRRSPKCSGRVGCFSSSTPTRSARRDGWSTMPSCPGSLAYLLRRATRSHGTRAWPQRRSNSWPCCSCFANPHSTLARAGSLFCARPGTRSPRRA